MAQLNRYDEVGIAFFEAMVRTLRQIEEAQPEPGFSSLFMDLLKQNMKLGSAAVAGEGLDIDQPLMDIHSGILQMFTATSLGEALENDDADE